LLFYPSKIYFGKDKRLQQGLENYLLRIVFQFYCGKKHYAAAYFDLPFLHLPLQYFTASQTSAHFLRQVKGLLHTGQIFCGRSLFFFCFIRMFCKQIQHDFV